MKVSWYKLRNVIVKDNRHRNTKQQEIPLTL